MRLASALSKALSRMLLLLVFCASVTAAFAQLKLSGTVIDTAGDRSVKNAVIMAVRLSDSVLVSFTRSKADGSFLINAPIDTFQVLVQSPGFGDKEFIVIGNDQNRDFNFGKVVMPLKSNSIGEVVIYGYKDAIYFKGDTIVYTADSFKVKENALVEDLLKKLPGIQVDNNGKIKSRGKEVAQVLVDGDEFFGSDPTMATRNLQADAVESVQVYEKKDDNAGSASGENITVMDLKLKEDAKKGQFGKASLAGDFNKFYEGEFLANRFNKKQKISLFGLVSNTPKANFSYMDTYNYGLDDGSYDTDMDEGIVNFPNYSNPVGFPLTRKLGFFYNDKPGEQSKVNGNYSYKENQLKVNNSTRTQYFLTDTAYTTENTETSGSTSSGHTINFKYSQNLDSLTTLTIEPKLAQNNTKTTKEVINRFYSENDDETRSTLTFNNSNLKATDFGTKMLLDRKFKKADRRLKVNYTFSYSEKESTGGLFTRYKFNEPSLPDSIVDQDKTANSLERVHRATVTYVEPLSKLWKLEVVYDLTNGSAEQKRESFNKIGDQRVKDPRFSNEFESNRTNNQATGGFIFENRKNRIYFGTNARINVAMNHNLVTNQDIRQTVQNILPKATYRYKINDNSQFYVRATTSSTIPTIQQLQPVPDNSNPNFIRNGNPDLLPGFTTTLDVNYYTFKVVTQTQIFSGATANFTNNDISYSTNYDSFGRTVTTPINVDGNYNYNAYIGGRYSLKAGILFLDYFANVNGSNTTNFINGNKNITKQIAGSLTPSVSYEGTKLKMDFAPSAVLNRTSSSLNSLSNRPFGTYSLRGGFSYKLPKNINIESDATYTKNTNRTSGYNLDFLIWNASANRKFFKRENFIVGLEIYDILNQNISANRTVQANTIVDSKTSIIARYVLLRATYRFDSKKEKITDDTF